MKKTFVVVLKKIKNTFIELGYFVLKFFYTKKKFEIYKKNFLLIPNCDDGRYSLEEQFYHGNLVKLKKPISFYYDQLVDFIKFKIDKKDGGLIMRVSDGEAYFLDGKLVGNGPKRHFTKSEKLTENYLTIFKNSLLACESRHVEMLKSNQKYFFKIYKKNIFSDIPFECIYALISSRKLLKSNYKIGIIGSNKKINIIKELLNNIEYQEYVGRDCFDDYIGIPEKGSANDPVLLAKTIKKELKPDIDIYIVGIGIAKLVVLPELRKNSKNLFIDVGAGISALAGLISNDRPYFASWKNFRLKDYDYSQIDIMDFDYKKDYVINL